MAVRDAIQAEFIPFIKAECAFLDEAAQALINAGDVKFYFSGPPKEHQFLRSQLDTQLPKTSKGPERGLGKIAADQIAAQHRAYNLRYGVNRLDVFVKTRVRHDQAALNREALQERVVKDMS